LKPDTLERTRFYPITAVCLACFLLTFVDTTLATLLGTILSFWLVLRSKPDGMFGLFLLLLLPQDFYDVAAGRTPQRAMETLLPALPLFKVDSMVCGFVTLRVFLERLLWPSTYRSRIPRLLFVLWAAAFIPVLVGFYLGYQTRNPNWTRGLRWLMISGSYFYGYILARRWPTGRSRLPLVLVLLPLVGTMLVLMEAGVYWSHHGFLILGLGGALSVYFMWNRERVNRLLGIFLLCVAAAFAAGGSLTAMGITLLSVVLSYVGTKKGVFPSIAHNRVVTGVGSMAIVGIVLFSFGIGMLGYHPRYKPSRSHGSEGGTLVERIEFKALSDRLPFWHAALKEILSGPHFIVPSDRPLRPETRGVPATWWMGAHNVVLESLRINGLFAGTVMLMIYFLALRNSLMVLTTSADSILRSLAAAVLGVGIVGMTTGDFPADMTVGFWLWSLAGLCHGLFLRSNPLVGHRESCQFWGPTAFRRVSLTAWNEIRRRFFPWKVMGMVRDPGCVSRNWIVAVSRLSPDAGESNIRTHA
jgi:hypothetical protein